ncbi:MAG: hypothetical protein WCH60_20685, partial [Burkholderiales bacterium]
MPTIDVASELRPTPAGSVAWINGSVLPELVLVAKVTVVGFEVVEPVVSPGPGATGSTVVTVVTEPLALVVVVCVGV